MINPATGEVQFPGETVIFGPATSRRDVEQSMSEMVMRRRETEGAMTWIELTDTRIGEYWFSRTLLFQRDTLKWVVFACRVPQPGKLRNNEDEAACKELHEALLLQSLGSKNTLYEFAWGRVFSDPDTEEGPSPILVSYETEGN
jgi:hypothetical protein